MQGRSKELDCSSTQFLVVGHRFKHTLTCFIYRVFSLTWPASMQIYWNKRNHLHKKRVQLPRDWFGTQHGRRFIVLGHQHGRRDII